MMKKKKRFTARLIAFAMLVSMLPSAAASAADDAQLLAIAATDGTALTQGTDYTYSGGTLNVTTDTPVTISMSGGAATTDEIITVDAKNYSPTVTFSGVSIKTTKRNAVKTNGAYSGESSVKFIFSGTNSFSAETDTFAAEYSRMEFTSTDEGVLNISDGGNGIRSDYANDKRTIEISGNLRLSIQDCLTHAIFTTGSAVKISGSPVINIDTTKTIDTASQYAIYGKGIDISGGKLTLSNNEECTRAGFAMCSTGKEPINISGAADVTVQSAYSGIQASNAQVNVSGNAKLKITDVVLNPLTCGSLAAKDNAYIEIFSKKGGIAANSAPSTVSEKAEINIKLDTDQSGNAFVFKTSLDIMNDAKVKIEVTNSAAESGSAPTVEGLKGSVPSSSAVNISDNAVVEISGAKNAVYSDLNMSGNTRLAITDSMYAIESGRSAVLTSPAKAEMTTTKKPFDNLTVKPETGKAYMVKSGKSSEAAETAYYTATQKLPKPSSSVRYFYAEPSDVVPVTITAADKEITYDGSTYDVSGLFVIDENAGEATYSVVSETGAAAGDGTLSGKVLTVTKAGKIKIKVNTAAKGNFLPGEQTAILTVKKGVAPAVSFTEPSEITYGDSLEKAVFQNPANGAYAWKDKTIVPSVGTNSYDVEFIPNDADLYDYSEVVCSEKVSVKVNPRPVEIAWTLPASLVYDGTDKTVTPSVANKVGEDVVNITSDGTLAAKNAGRYSARVTAVDNPNYTLEGGTNLETNYTIEPKTLNADNVAAIADAVYTGEEIKPAPEVKDGDVTLTPDADYTVAYENNINAGIAKANITFIGNYTGTAQKEFTILPKTIDPNIALEAPVRNGVPQTSIETDEYTATVSWSPEVTDNFAQSTVYTAAVKITPKTNYTVNGIAADGYIFAGSDRVEYDEATGIITVVYPDTGRRSSSSGRTTRFTVTFNSDGGSRVSSQTVAINSSIKKPADPAKEGFDFGGWYTDKELKSEYDFSEKVTKSFTLYAAWNEKDNSENQIILFIGQKDASVFGRTRTNDVAPLIANSRTMLPARFVAENLGADVEWDGEQQLVTITGKHLKTDKDITILITIGAESAVVNGEKVKLDSPAFIENDRTYTPVRFIAEELGASVEWFEDDRKVVITK